MADEPAPLPIQPRRGGVSGTGVVTEVLSGDSFVVRGASVDGSAPPKKQLAVSGVVAPAIARGRSQVDKPFAFHAREFLRKKILGKVVKFKVNFTTGNPGEREYADVHFQGENLATTLVASGWCTVKAPSGDGKIPADKAALMETESRAEKAGLGVHQKGVDPEDFVRDVDHSVDSQAFFSANKGIPLPAIIDKVIDGSTYRTELLGAGLKNHTMITLILAGAECPRVPLSFEVQKQLYDRRIAAGETNPRKPIDEKPEPFALEAKTYVETRLLNRDIQVLLQGSDKYGNLYGEILFPRGNITEKLLSEGFAKLVNWSVELTRDPALLRGAQQVAITKQARLYKTYVPQEKKVVVHQNYKVIQVLSGDQILTRDPEGNELRFFLASVRAPRLGVRSRGIEDKPYAHEAREFLRSRLIGRKCRIEIEYTLPSTAGASDGDHRQFVSVFREKDCLNLGLVRLGYATVSPHQRDEDRAHNYQALLAAEADAEKRRVGVHSHKDYGGRKIADLSVRGRRRVVVSNGDENGNENAAKSGSKARAYLDTFRSEKSMNGVVEYVFSSSRLKVLIPKYNVMIPLALASVRSPPRLDAEGEANKFSEMGLQFVRELCLQRDVRVNIENLDKGDNFIGNIFIGKNNLAATLTQQGLVTVHAPSARRSPFGESLMDLEIAAQEAKAGLWHDWDPSAAIVTENKESESESASLGISIGEDVEITVTEIADCSNFFVQFAKDKNASVVNSGMQTLSEKLGSPDDDTTYVPPKKGAVCAGYFEPEGQWYRVRSEGGAKDEFRVLYIDFGNRSVLPTTHIRELPEELVTIPSLAHPAALAGVRTVAQTSDYYYDCANAFNDLVYDRDITAKVLQVGRDGRLQFLLIDKKDDSSSINSQIVAGGWGKVMPRTGGRAMKTLLDGLQADEKQAQAKHFGLWEYGTVSDDEDEDPNARWGGGRVPSEKQRQAAAAAKEARRG